MIITKDYLKSIKPKVKGIDDKYTWWMYKKLKEMTTFQSKHIDREVFVYKSIPKETEGQMLYTRIYIGWSDGTRCITGYPINGKTEGCYMFGMGNNPRRDKYFEEIKDFFDKYLKIGICSYAEHNSWYGDNRYIEIGNTRKCKYCGHWQKREFYTIKEIKRYEKWVY